MVTDCFSIKVRDKDSQQHPTNTYILTLNSPATPKHIKVQYLGVKVEIYITNPLRCFNCQQYEERLPQCCSLRSLWWKASPRTVFQPFQVQELFWPSPSVQQGLSRVEAGKESVEAESEAQHVIHRSSTQGGS